MDVLRLDLTDARGLLTRSWIDGSLAALDRSAAGAIVIESRAPSFCEGLDLDSLEAAAPPDAGVEAFGALLDRLERDGRPVVAVVDGAARGGGVGLAAVADLVIASERASFSLPEALLGLLPAVIFPFVARRTGVPRARWLALSGEALSAERAAGYGLADELAADPPRALERQLARLSRMDPRAHAAIKPLVARHFADPVGYRGDAIGAFSALLTSPRSRERIRRLREGLAPWDEGLGD